MLHGGGYTIGSAKGYRAYAAEVSRVTKARVFVPEYRLAPEHPFPAAIEDARSVLAAAMDEAGPQSCFATGDSAGGGLVLSALWELRRGGGPLPACIVLVSPLVDLTVTNASFDERAHVDPSSRARVFNVRRRCISPGEGLMMPRPRSRCGRTSGGFRLACCSWEVRSACWTTRATWRPSSSAKGCRSIIASTRTWCMCGRCSRSSCPRRKRHCGRSAPSWAPGSPGRADNRVPERARVDGIHRYRYADET